MPTLRRRVAAIARACGVAGYPLDTKHPAIRETLRGIGRKHGSPRRRAAAITTTEVRKLCGACGPDLAGARDRALSLLGFAGALRRSELVGLDVEHVTWIGNGLKLLIERSKTDAQGEGAEITIPQGRADDTCPITALKTWLELSEITTGPVFRKVNRGGVVERARLATDAVRQLLLKRAAKAGLKGTLAEPFTPHGLCAGFVTTAYRNGVPDEEIMWSTGKAAETQDDILRSAWAAPPAKQVNSCSAALHAPSLSSAFNVAVDARLRCCLVWFGRLVTLSGTLRGAAFRFPERRHLLNQ
jgi:integrase